MEGYLIGYEKSLLLLSTTRLILFDFFFFFLFLPSCTQNAIYIFREINSDLSRYKLSHICHEENSLYDQVMTSHHCIFCLYL